jgi:hypothetical protein
MNIELEGWRRASSAMSGLWRQLVRIIIFLDSKSILARNADRSEKSYVDASATVKKLAFYAKRNKRP